MTIGTPADDDRVLDAIEQLASPLGLAELLGCCPPATGPGACRTWWTASTPPTSVSPPRPPSPTRGLTAPDPGGTERWDAHQVWAHLAEIGGYWSGELRRVVDAGAGTPATIGRSLSDPSRVDAIEAGRTRPVADNVAVTRRSLDALRAYLAGLSEADWTSASAGTCPPAR